MFSIIANYILLALVVVLAVLLYLQRRQTRRDTSPGELEEILESLRRSIEILRQEGQIQKIASQLSQILTTNLAADRILFFRKQRRFMELGYVYGMKNLKWNKYRFTAERRLVGLLSGEKPFLDPQSLEGVIGKELNDLIRRENFNLVLPISWNNVVFGVYFVRTSLEQDNPLIKTFLLFLNQNLSAAYYLKRLESSKQVLEQKLADGKKIIAELQGSDTDKPIDDPGHLIEIFNHHRTDELVSGLFNRIRVGLKADKLVFISPGEPGDSAAMKYSHGLNRTDLNLSKLTFREITSGLEKQAIYEAARVTGQHPDETGLKELIRKNDLGRASLFTLDKKTPGLLLWASKEPEENVERRLLNRLERVAGQAMENARAFEKMESQIYIDGLTRLYNHRYFVGRLEEEVQRAKRYKRTLALLIFDIDDFKVFNDKFGHQYGNDLLKRMGTKLRQSIRTIDIVARFGGDEFCIIMPEADRNTCLNFMDRLRRDIAAADFGQEKVGSAGRITISLGGAVYPDDADNAKDLTYCADMALIQSKSTGRNRASLYDPANDRDRKLTE